MVPKVPPPEIGDQVAIVASRIAACVPASLPSSGTAAIAALAKPVAASTAPCGTATPWAYSGYWRIVMSSGVSPTDFSSAWGMIQDEAYFPGMPRFLPFGSAAVLMPDDAFAKTIDGY